MEATTYFSLLHNLKYRRLLYSNVVNRLGDAIDTLAFSWIVYAFTGEGSWAAIIFAINKIPTFIALPFAGAYVEKLNKKRTLIICDIIRCAFVVMLLIVFLTEQLSVPILATFTFCISMAEAFRMPASTAFLTQILDKDAFDKGVALNVIVSTLVEIIGAALGGMFITYLGTQIAIVADAVSFVISIFFVLRISHTENIEKHIKSTGSWSLLKSGLVYIKSCGILVSTFAMAVLANAAMSPIDSLQTVVVVDIFHSHASYLSALNICLSIGMLLGSVLYPMIRTHMKDWVLFRLAFLLIAFLYFVTALAGFAESFNSVFTIAFCGLYVFYGIAASFLSIGLGLLLLENTGQSYMARVNTWFSAISAAATPAGAAFAGYLAKYFPLSGIFIAIAGVILCSLLLALFGNCGKRQ